MQVSKNTFGFFILSLSSCAHPLDWLETLESPSISMFWIQPFFIIINIIFPSWISLVFQTLSIQNLLSAITYPYIMSLQKVVAAWLHESEHSCSDLGSVRSISTCSAICLYRVIAHSFQLAFLTVFHNNNKKPSQLMSQTVRDQH